MNSLTSLGNIAAPFDSGSEGGESEADSDSTSDDSVPLGEENMPLASRAIEIPSSLPPSDGDDVPLTTVGRTAIR